MDPPDGPAVALHGANHPSLSLRLVTPDGDILDAGVDFNLHAWPPVPCAKYFDDRAWSAVESFAARVVLGEACVSSLAPGEMEPAGVCPGRGVNQDGTRIETLPMRTKGSRGRRTNVRVHLAYYGPAFTGWAWTPENDKDYTHRPRPADATTNASTTNASLDSADANAEDDAVDATRGSSTEWRYGERSVSASIQRALRPLFSSDEDRLIHGAGRTDKGVHASAQCFSVWSNASTFTPRDVRDALTAHPAAAAGAWRVVGEPEEVSDSFHATFCATWRRYVYVLPMRALGDEEGTPFDVAVDPSATNAMLNALEGKSTDMFAFARATPPGKDTTCFVKVARAFEATVPASKGAERGVGRGARRRKSSQGFSEDGGLGRVGGGGGGSPDGTTERVLVVELVADRFLRKMVRTLVATAVREAATGARGDVLLRLARAGERAATAPPAPPEGLIFAGVGYGNHPVWDAEGRATESRRRRIINATRRP